MKCWCRAIAIVLLGCLGSAASRAQDGAADDGQRVDQLFDAYNTTDSPGCAVGVLRDGRLIHSKGYGMGSLELGVPLTAQSTFYLASVSKQFTAASVVLAAEQGYLSLDDDVRKYVPELPSYSRPVSLRQMLHHTSGYRDVLSLLELSGRNLEDIHSTAEMLDLVSRQKELNYLPGDEYDYSNTNYWLMSLVIPRATGKTLAQFAEDNIFKPLGMRHTRFYDDRTAVVRGRVPAYGRRDDGSYRIAWSTNFDAVGDGGLVSSIEDLVLWDQNFYANRIGKGTLVRELQTPGRLNDGKTIEYGLGLTVGRYRGLPFVAHGGALFGYRTQLLRFPEQKFSVICLCNLAGINTRQSARQVAEIYLGDVFPAKPHASAVQADLESLAGRYRAPESHTVAEFKVVDSDLGWYGQRFRPIEADKFLADSAETLEFERSHGKPVAVTLAGGDTRPERFERLLPFTPAAADLARYAGVYYSEELQANYRFSVQDGKFSLSAGWAEPVVLDPVAQGEFWNASGSAIVFRLAANGDVVGCDLFAGRVRRIAFVKVSPP